MPNTPTKEPNPSGLHQPKLTRRQKAFADTLIANPKLSGTQAALRTHNAATPAAAAVTASRLLSNAKVITYLEGHQQLAGNTLVEITRSKRANYETRRKAANDILDRTLGKPLQQQVSANVHSINISFGKPKD